MKVNTLAQSAVASAQALNQVLQEAQAAQTQHAEKLVKFAVTQSVSLPGMGENIDVTA